MKDKYPMQPIRDGRFESNPIVVWLCDEASNMNDIARYCAENEIDNKYQEQLAQLVGYSVGGYGSLSYVSDESYERTENQMNIDKVETQTPEEKTAKDMLSEHKHGDEYVVTNERWKNGDECLSSTGCLFTFIGLCNTNGFDCILLSKDGVPTFGFTKELSKPETPQQREDRERLEAAYDLFVCAADDGVAVNPNLKDWKSKYPSVVKMWLRVVDKTNYRKGMK